MGISKPIQRRRNQERIFAKGSSLLEELPQATQEGGKNVSANGFASITQVYP